MTLEDQVCSLELAKRLKELGIRQESLFFWEKSEHKIYINEDGEKEIEEYKTSLCMHAMFDLSNSIEYWSAFTVAELGHMLPGFIPYEGTTARLEFVKNDITKTWMLAYVISNDEPPVVCIITKNEAGARAKMLIHLLENKLMELPQ